MRFRPAIVDFSPGYDLQESSFPLANSELSYPIETIPIKTSYMGMVFWLLL